MYVAPSAELISFHGVEPVIGFGVFIAPGAKIIGDVILADQQTSIWYNTVVRGDIHFIRIGRQTNIQDQCVVHVTGETHPVTIGDRVTVGHSAVIHGCTLRDGCLVGMGAVVLDGAVVGAGAMVAAGAVVPPGLEIPPGTLAVGSPARVKRTLREEEREHLVFAAESYLDTARRHARELKLIPPDED